MEQWTVVRVIAALGVTMVALVAPVIKVVLDYRVSWGARDRMLEAEQRAFATPVAESSHGDASGTVHGAPEDNAEDSGLGLGFTQGFPNAMALFDVYNKQVAKYQADTQARASSSFAFAAIAMFVGLAFVLWGAGTLLRAGAWYHIAAGSAVSSIGGWISSYVTKTFLDVHKLSLAQLNTYFRQPVLSAYVLNAQRVADLLEDSEAKKLAYIEIVHRITALIHDGGTHDQEPASRKSDEAGPVDRGASLSSLHERVQSHSQLQVTR